MALKITEYPTCPYCGTDVENVRTDREFDELIAGSVPEYRFIADVWHYAVPCGHELSPKDLDGMTWKAEPDADHPVRFGK